MPRPDKISPAWSRLALALLALALAAALALWLKDLWGTPGAPKRQVARIALLPDQPPPPPPPPKEEKPPPPREQPQLQPQAPKPAEVPQPANAPLKMEGTAGDGPSAFAAGTVQKEYSGGVPQIGPAASAASVADRAQERFYVHSARQLLRDALERHFRSDFVEASVDFTLWLQRDGGIRKAELASSGNTRLDDDLRAALDQTTRQLQLPPPPPRMAAGEPMRFRLTIRPQA